MKSVTKILIGISILISHLSAQNTDLAVICNDDGDCIEYSRVKPTNGDWKDACCSDFDYDKSTFDCTDDCGDSDDGEEDGYENKDFSSLPSTFNMLNGNKLWVFDSEGNQKQKNVTDSAFIASIDNNVFNNPDFSHISIKINSNTYAVVGNDPNNGDNNDAGILQACINGRCVEITRLKYHGRWHNACCKDLSGSQVIDCTDDCGGGDGGLVDGSNMPPDVQNQPEHFLTANNRKIWIINNDDNSISSYTYPIGGLIYNKVTIISDYSFIDGINNDGSLLEYVTTNINDTLYAIIESFDTSQLRGKINPKPLLDHLKKKSGIKLFPNPTQINSKVYFQAPKRKVKKIQLIDLASGVKYKVTFKKIDNNKVSFIAPNKLGTYKVMVFLKDSNIIKRRLIITK